jgi:aerobic-type carbon monoxide dehydrogenase small subunit (CoxS/CutS family)
VSGLDFQVNGQPRSFSVAEDTLLLDLLRDEAGLTSVREGCGVGACGACTVLLDGKPVSSCLLYAFRCVGRAVETVEARREDDLDPVQRAFLESGALQCGYCTPGLVLTVRALLAENPSPSDSEASEYLAGNLCRCGAYVEILSAVQRAAAELRRETPMMSEASSEATR